MPPRVLIVDDHAPFRDAARRVLSAAGFDVVAGAADAADALRLARELTARPGAPAVVLVSGRPRSDYGRLVERSGARGFIDKAEFSGPRLRAVLA